MYRIKTLNKISNAGLNLLDQTRFQVGSDVENEDGILVRSAPMHDYEFPDALRAIARAGAGTNNIPIDRCSESGIVVFNTPGANSNAVKELVVAAMLIASRDIIGGVEWVQEQVHTPGVDIAQAVEKGKSAFVGPEIYRKTLGVIGLGAIGALVCNIALDLGMDVYGYDPFLSVDAALRLDRHVHVVKNVDDLYRVSDYITIHIPYNNDTKDFINAEAISKMKGQVRVLNLARGGLVNDDDMIEALESGRVARYITDFPDDKIAPVKNVIAFPHLGEERHRLPPPGGLHSGERGELRPHGRRPTEGLSDQRQHQKLRQPAQCVPGVERHLPGVSDPQEHSRHAHPHHLHSGGRGGQRGEYDQQVPEGLRLHHGGSEQPHQGHSGR